MDRMPYTTTAEWDDAYTNGAYIENGDTYPQRWAADARAFRARIDAEGRFRGDIPYGPHVRNRFDLFLPRGAALGLVVFVHGGYWLRFDKSSWSHLAAGPLEHGLAVAMPSYVLCPQARIAEITQQVGAAITVASAEIPGLIHLAGHSAGGHLVSRMASDTSPLGPDVFERVRKIVSISGVHDLHPLMHTTMNETLRIDAAEAAAESPALLRPRNGADITFWVGADERPEFLRQTALMKRAWSAPTIVEQGLNHFTVVEGMADRNHPLVETLLGL